MRSGASRFHVPVSSGSECRLPSATRHARCTHSQTLAGETTHGTATRVRVLSECKAVLLTSDPSRSRQSASKRDPRRKGNMSSTTCKIRLASVNCDSGAKVDAGDRREVRTSRFVHLFFHIDIYTRTARPMQRDRARRRGAHVAAKTATAT